MIRYRSLFEVDIAHDYFLSRGSVVFEAQPEAARTALKATYSVPGLFEILPDAATSATLAGHKLVLRETSTGFLVAAQLDPFAPDIRPAIAPRADFKLTFGLRPKDSSFLNYTELGANTTGFHRFGNDSLNQVAGEGYLSRPVAGFATTRRVGSPGTELEFAL